MKYIILVTPFILILTPIFYLWQHNKEQVNPEILPQIMGGALLASIFILSVFWSISKDRYKAVASSGVAIGLFFVYGRLFDLGWRTGLFLSMTSLNILLSFLFISLAVSLWLFIRRMSDARPCANFLLVFGLIMTILPMIEMASSLFLNPIKPNDYTTFVFTPVNFGNRPPLLEKETDDNPDIYYVILDGYARQDILMDRYGFDNSSFLNSLRNRGFYIVEKSTSNYSTTYFSLSSTLNMKYVNKEILQIQSSKRSDSSSMRHLRLLGCQAPHIASMIQDNTVGRFMQSKGYKYVTVNTNWGGTETSKIADIQFKKPGWVTGEFATVLIDTTAARSLAPSVAEAHRFAFSAVEDAAKIQGPTFTFSHMLVPHNPYVFDAFGNERVNIPLSLQWTEKTGGWRAKQDYINQLIYTNNRTLKMIDKVIASSTVRPVIILQSDHGSSTGISPGSGGPLTDDGIDFLHERHSNLNAWLVPEKVKQKLTPKLCSVNTFRLLFSEMFEADYPMLEQRNYFSSYGTPYALREVTNVIKED